MSGLGVFLFAIFVLVAIGFHEFGHFATAKWFGIKVEKFFIGFGPKIWSTRRGETEYGIAWIPAGGYVRISGMNPLEEIPPEDRDRTFKSKPAWQRAIVLVAGSFTHFLIAFLMTSALLAIVGLPERLTRQIDEVLAKEGGKTLPAAAAGFRVGDEIAAVDGKPVATWDEMSAIIRGRPNETVRFTVRRAERTLDLTATLTSRELNGKTVGFLGVSPRIENVRRSVGSAVGQAGSFLGRASVESLRALGKIVSPSSIGRLFAVASGDKPRWSTDPTSIVGIGKVAGDLTREGRFTDLLFLFVGFNIFVGVANLLPLPPLDGGHLAVVGYEKLTRRDVDMRRLMPVTAAVVSILIGLFVLLLYLDIVRPLPSIPG